MAAAHRIVRSFPHRSCVSLSIHIRGLRTACCRGNGRRNPAGLLRYRAASFDCWRRGAAIRSNRYRCDCRGHPPADEGCPIALIAGSGRPCEGSGVYVGRLRSWNTGSDLCGYRSRSSSWILVSVFSSRYFTITGVYSEIPQSTPLPRVIARDPATTTAPSGTISGWSSVAV